MYFKGIKSESPQCKIKYKHFNFPESCFLNSVGFPILDIFLYCLASLSLYIIVIKEASLLNGIRTRGCLNLEVWLTSWSCFNWHSAVISELPFLKCHWISYCYTLLWLSCCLRFYQCVSCWLLLKLLLNWEQDDVYCMSSLPPLPR